MRGHSDDLFQDGSYDRYEDDDDDDFSDTDEYGDDEYGDDDESWGEPTRDCPYCGREMLEIAVQCTGCGNYLSDEDTAPSGKPLWFIVVALLCLAGLLLSI